MKRIFDLILVFFASIFLTVPMLLIAILIRFLLGSPVLFKQTRPGRCGKSFKMIKFRTMADARNSSGRLLSDSERLTPFGQFLRSTSLDELPEFWNVLKGDMSLVGPRPLLIEYLHLYTPHQARRHEARPGITGWAQVNGRNSLSWEEKFDLDVWYVDNQSFLLDMKILWLTVRKVLQREGISASGEATMSKFTGSQSCKKLALLGASGNGKVVANIAQELGWQEIVFFDDAWPQLTTNGHWPVIGNTEMLLSSIGDYSGVVVSIGDCAIRWDKHQALKALNANLISLVHPRSVISQYANIGLGSVVMAGAVINADASIGEACIINTGATVDHDCALGNGVHISPGAHLSGNVAIDTCSWVGVGSCIRQGIHIGSSTVIGAGSVVVNDIASNVTAFGHPASIQATDRLS